MRARTAFAHAAALAAAASLLAACSGAAATSPGTSSAAQTPGAQGTAQGKPSGGQTSKPPAAPVNLTPNVQDGATSVKVSTLVSVKATAGRITKVTLDYRAVDRRGRTVKGNVTGILSKDRASWVAADRLQPAASYTLTMTGENTERQATTATAAFRTQNLSLAQQTFAELYPLAGSHVGVGMPVVLRFDVPVRNKKEFQKNLHVSSSPAQVGTWSWFSDREVHFRPKNYWKPGTKVTVHADVNGVSAGGGIYGQNSASTSFTVGRSLITKINLASDIARVYRSGKLVRTIPVSGGKPGWQSRSGTKLIMDKLYQTRMTNEMIGAKEQYDLKVYYAMRVTSSGEFLHAAPWNAGYFGRTNASHGCIGMSTGNASWLFGQVLIGDPVVTTGTSRGLERGNGYSDWNVSYKEYAKGSAL
jgi:lipoprotein-anchoring transpeptidase ErfK/SrfK